MGNKANLLNGKPIRKASKGLSRRLWRGLWVVFMIGIALLLTGCPSEDKAYSIAPEHYLMGWILHNVNNSTPTTLDYTQDKLAELNYTFNYPAGVPVTYSDVLFWLPPVHRYGSGMGVSSWVEIDVPITKTYYLYGINPAPEYYQTNWSFSNTMHINYLHSQNPSKEFAYDVMQSEKYNSERDAFHGIRPVPGEKKHIFFGTAPYMVPRVYINSSHIRLSDYLITGNGRLSHLERETVMSVSNGSATITVKLPKPIYQVYQNNVLVETGELTSNNQWDPTVLDYPLSNGNYSINVSIVSSYPIWNKTHIIASFEYPGTDTNPPLLQYVNISPRFEIGKPIHISVNFSDESLANVSVFYSTDNNPSWNKLASANLTINNTNATAINLKLTANDTSNNSVSYTIMPASLRAKKANFNLASGANSVTAGSTVSVSGECQDSQGKACPGLRFVCSLNGRGIDTDRTEFADSFKGTPAGTFNKTLQIPVNVSGNQINFSVAFAGSGAFKPVNESLLLNLVEYQYDVGIYNLSAVNTTLGSVARINATVYNHGQYDALNLNVSLFVNHRAVSATLIPRLNASKSESVGFRWSPKASGSYNISLFVQPITNESYTENNLVSKVLELGGDIEAELTLPEWSFAVNQTTQMRIDYKNSGNDTATNITAVFYDWFNYTYGYPSYGEPTRLDFNDTIYSIVPRKNGSSVSFSINFSQRSEGFSLHEGQSITLSNGVRFDLEYRFDSGCKILLGFADISSEALPDLIPKEQGLAHMNWTPTRLGYHTLKLFLNTSSDRDWENNADYLSANVKRNLPDISVDMLSPTFVTVGKPANATLYLYNSGLVDATGLNGTLAIYHPVNELYIPYNTTQGMALNGTEYIIHVSKVGDYANISVSWGNRNETHLLREGDNATLNGGVVLGCDYLGTYGSTLMLSKVMSVSHLDLPNVRSGYSNSIQRNWTPEALGNYVLQAKVDLPLDGDLSDNFAYRSIQAKKNGPDLVLSITTEENYGVTDRNNTILIFLPNYGPQAAKNVTLTLLDLYNYTNVAGDYNETVPFMFDGTNYTITTQRAASSLLINLSFSGGSERFLLPPHSFVRLGNGKWLLVRQMYDKFARVYLGDGAAKSFELQDIPAMDYAYTAVNLTPHLKGWHVLAGFANASSETNLTDNFDSELLLVKKDGPNPSPFIYANTYLPVNQSSTLTIRVQNYGTKNANEINLSLFNFPRFSYYSLNLNASIDFNGTEYTINTTLLNSTTVRVNISYEKAFESATLNIGQPMKLKNGVFYILNGIGRYCEVYFAIGNSTNITISSPAGGYTDKYFNFTPGSKGAYMLYTYASTEGDTVLTNNFNMKLVFGKEDWNDLKAYFDLPNTLNQQRVTVPLQIFNVGTQRVSNTTLEFYDNNKLLLKLKNITLPWQDEAYEYDFNWEPSSLGYHSLKLVAGCLGDTNITDNTKTVTVYVYRLVNRSFTVVNMSDSLSEWRLGVNEEGLYSVPNIVPFYYPTTNLALIHSNGFANSSISFQQSNSSKNFSVVSQFIANLTHKFFVFANHPSWEFNSSAFQLVVKNYTQIVSNVTNFVVYGCKEWDFMRKDCATGWKVTQDYVNTSVENGKSWLYASTPFCGGITTFAIGERDSDLDGIPDSLEYDNDNDGINDSYDNCPTVFNPQQKDVDNDGLGDRCDGDADGDNTPDENDPIIGLSESIVSDTPVSVIVNNSTNITRQIHSRQLVKFKLRNRTLVSFRFNFSRGRLALTNITIELQTNTSPRGYVLIKGLSLTGLNETKTVYVDRLTSSISSVCIKDAEVNNISEMSSNCNGANETFVVCNGSLQGGYNCTVNESRFKVAGVRHSLIEEMPLVSKGSSVSGSSSYSTTMLLTSPSCNSLCGNWSECNSSGKRVRECLDSCTRLTTIETLDCNYDHCSNGMLDNSETDTDCGGSCPACPDGKACLSDSDCINDCQNKRCMSVKPLKSEPKPEASCVDGIQNQGEKGPDCGGPCPACMGTKNRANYLVTTAMIGIISGILAALGWSWFNRPASRLSKLISQANRAILNKDINAAVGLYGQIEEHYNRLPHIERKRYHKPIMSLYSKIVALKRTNEGNSEKEAYTNGSKQQINPSVP